MAQLYVANVNFESTGNNQLAYSSNSITVRLGGANVLTVNSSGIVPNSSLTVPAGSQNFISNLVATVNSSVTVSGAVIIDGKVTPTVIAANTADWAPGIGNVYNIRVSSNTNVVNSEFMITGMTAGTNGQLVVLHNIGAMGIHIRNEEAGSNSVFFAGVDVPASTAANRFNMPNHFKLQGYQSAMFYYDGALQRWRPTDSNSINFEFKSQRATGFFGGGATPAATNTTIRITYSSEVSAAVTPANLSLARNSLAGAGNIIKGFFAGGSVTPAGTATTDRTTFSTEATAAVTGANLSSGRGNISGTGNACKGFFGGGALAATTDRTTFSTETTAAVPGANLSGGRGNHVGVGNSCKGFFAGGNTPTIITTTDKINFTTETTSVVPGAALSQARFGAAAAGNFDKGFVSGGITASTPAIAVTATSDRITYSTETTVAVPGANLTQARTYAGGSGNADKGFFAGGSTPTVGLITDRTTYSTETTAAAPVSNLPAARHLPGSL